jgi:hypothetical protein
MVSDELRIAAWHCRNGTARPADPQTALAVELFELASRLPFDKAQEAA